MSSLQSLPTKWEPADAPWATLLIAEEKRHTSHGWPDPGSNPGPTSN